MAHSGSKRTGVADAVVAVHGPSELGALLERHGLTCRGLEPVAREGPPRLVLLDGTGAFRRNALEEVRAAHARWPLVDILVRSPAASAEEVRGLLHAGARDVVLNDDDEALVEAVTTTLGAQRILPRVEDLAAKRVRLSKFEGMYSRSHAMWDVFETCARVAPTDANVLIIGETGTGKELLARALHRRSGRSGRFVPINCSAIPEHLIESELFGHEKGAFTGAARANRGIFRHAEGGTVFLDEIGDMPEAAQQSLLRVLEARTVRPVGSAEEVPVNVRVLAATHVQLEDVVAEGSFREDLFYRIDVIRLQIPPLRERPEDIVYLFGYFLKSLATHYGVERPRLSDAFMDELSAHTWPGNVRELENLAERAVLRGKRSSLSASDLRRLLRPGDAATNEGTDDGASDEGGDAVDVDTSSTLEESIGPVVERAERHYLEALLTETGGRMQESARRAGISRRTLQRKLAALGIDKARFRRTANR